jgi:hypothetical protein
MHPYRLPPFLAGLLFAGAFATTGWSQTPPPEPANKDPRETRRIGRPVLPDPTLFDGSVPGMQQEKRQERGMLGEFEIEGQDNKNAKTVGGRPGQPKQSSSGKQQPQSGQQQQSGGQSAGAQDQQQQGGGAQGQQGGQGGQGGQQGGQGGQGGQQGGQGGAGQMGQPGGAGGTSGASMQIPGAEGMGGGAAGGEQSQGGQSGGGGAGGDPGSAGDAGGPGGGPSGPGDPSATAEGIRVGELRGADGKIDPNAQVTNMPNKPKEIKIGDASQQINASAPPNVVGAQQPTGSSTQNMEKQVGRGTYGGGDNTNKGSEKGRTMPPGM